ncbi:hypothetical protein [Agaribacterium sp. ZY112]|uniref:hypothetical protein n=1 Tax=Agaribacterium sp. ZY112 TaxID=3233574 RepID=UPI0035269A87
MPLVEGGDIPSIYSDKRISPGEWLLLKGENLGVTKLTMDGISVEVEYYYDEQPLIRVPTHLQALQQHQLILESPFGKANYFFDSHHYVVATDPAGEQSLLVRSNRREDEGIDDDWLSIKEKDKAPLYSHISKGSQFLYIVSQKIKPKGIVAGASTYSLELSSYHLSAPDKPALLSRIDIELDSRPVTSVLSSDGQLYILGSQSLSVVDVSDPVKMQSYLQEGLALNPLGLTSYVDILALDTKGTLAVLDAYANRVDILSINSQEMKRIASKSVAPGHDLPSAVRLVHDPRNASEFWVLLSPNHRQLIDGLVKNYQKLNNKESLALIDGTLHQIQQLRLENSDLHLGQSWPLDKGYASFFLAPSIDEGHLLYTSTKLDLFSLVDNSRAAKYSLKRAKSLLWDSVALGRVNEINLGNGQIQQRASGVGLYFHVLDAPDFGAVFSIMKLGPAFSSPYISPHWGIAIERNGTYVRRKMNRDSLFPPYKVGRVSFQY